MEHEVANYRGSWIEQMPHRTEAAFFMETFVFLILFAWRAGGLMFIGMAFWKWDVLTGRRSTGIYATFLVAGLLGIPLILYGVHRNFAADWSVSSTSAFRNESGCISHGARVSSLRGSALLSR